LHFSSVVERYIFESKAHAISTDYPHNSSGTRQRVPSLRKLQLYPYQRPYGKCFISTNHCAIKTQVECVAYRSLLINLHGNFAGHLHPLKLS
jgi:hypothetical protein